MPPQVAARPLRNGGNSEKLLPRRYQLPHLRLCIPLWANCGQPSRRCRVRPQPRLIPKHCTQTTQSVRVSCTTRSAPSAAQTSCCPQRAQPLLLLLKSLHSLLFRKSCWGRAVPHPAFEAGKNRVSLIPISFQDGLRRSTVVVRQPFRSSGRMTGTGDRRREARLTTGGAADIRLAVRGDEGTQWTWRRPPSA